MNHCCSGKARSIAYSECILVALDIEQAVRMRYIVISGLHGPTMFLHIIWQPERFSSESYWTQNVCFDFLCNFCLKHISFWEELSQIWSEMCIDLHVKYALFLSDFKSKSKGRFMGLFNTAAFRPIVFLPPTSSRIHLQRRHASHRCARPLPAKAGTIINEFC